jgi:predicted PurR-regulated permease PerM
MSERLVPVSVPSTLGERTLRGLLLLSAIAVCGVLVWELSFLLGPVAFALIGFYVMAPAVNFLELRGLPRWAAVSVCFAVMLLLVVGIAFAVWPALESWLRQAPTPGQQSVFERRLGDRLDAFERDAAAMWPRFDWHHTFGHVREFLDREGRRLTEDFPELVSRALSHAGTYLLAPVITFFLLLQGAEMNRWLLARVPNRYFELVLVLRHRVDRQIAAYLRGAASESVAVALLLTLLLAVVGMPHALLFGALYGLLNVVPIVGPLIGASAGLLYALMDPSAPGLAALAICYAATYGLDAMFINPFLVGKNLQLHPLTVLVGVSIGGTLAGILGMLVVVPLIAIAKAVGVTVVEAVRRHA